MPNVKISALPEFTGNTQDAYLVMNDSTQTTTYKVKKENLTTPSAGFSWVNGSPAYFNFTNGVDTYIPWNTQIFNTNTNVFELVNSGSTAGTRGNEGARIHFKQPGIYEISCQIHWFDLTGNVDFLIRVSSAATSGGTMSSFTLIHDYKSAEASGTDQLMNGTLMLNVTAAGFYTLCVQPSANTPFPSDSNNTPSRIFVKKIS
jgi:hypothetical protein